MIGALSLAEVMEQTARQLCGWPDCGELADGHGFCRKHALRIQRGRELGCETPWEQLVSAALQLAAAESDADFDVAAARLKYAAITFRNVVRPSAPRKDKGKPRSRQVDRDVARAETKLARRGIYVTGGTR